MRILVCFLLFFLSVCYCSQRGHSVHLENYGDRISRYKHGRIYRPCAFQDLDCIREVFAHNSDCKPVKGPIDDPYKLDRLPVNLAHANVTYILQNAQVRGLNDWKIKEFYINERTDKLVLEVVFDAITLFCPAALVKYHRKGKEPIERTDYSTVINKDISLTLTVPNIKDLQLSAAHVYAYIPDPNPPFVVGPGVADDSDPTVTAAFKEMISNIAVGIKEIFIVKGPLFMTAFMEGTICDFSNNKRKH